MVKISNENFLRCNKYKLRTVLDHYRNVGNNFVSVTKLPRRVTVGSVFLNTPFNLTEVAQSIGFFDYKIFPSEIMQFCGQWQTEGRAIQAGDIIVQCARLPLGWFRGVFAVKILSVERNADYCLLSYGTLIGHVEMGMSIFTLKRIGRMIQFEIETFSQPALFITRLASPVTRSYQQYCTKQGITKVLQAIQSLN